MRQAPGEARRVLGVEYSIFDLGVSTAYCNREVIVSAGYIGSPQLLLLSGIGPKDHLSAAGVKLELELPGVGQQLEGRPLVQPVYSGTLLTNEENPRLYGAPTEFTSWHNSGVG